LTATSRLARELHAERDAEMRRRGLRLWPTPRILPFTNWIEECWTSASPKESALSIQQDRFLWQRVILDSPESADLLQIAGAAAAAQDAWRLIREWQLPVSEARFVETEDSEAFLRWLRVHQRRCEQSGWIDPPRLMDRVAAMVGSIELPSSVVLAGFDEITPQMRGLVTSLEQAGCASRLMDPPRVEPAHASLCVCRDAEHELRAAALWAREAVEARPGARVGVVVADLAQVHAMVERIFTEVLNPAVALLDSPSSSRAFHISLGGRFADDPIAHSAMLILELAHGSLSLDRMGSLLRSPFLGGSGSERSNRALTDALLRQPHPSQVTIAALLDACRKHSPLLARMVERWDKIRRAMPPKSALPSVWSGHFARLLAALEWPGSESLTSREHQAVEEWQELLSRFATLDAVMGATPFSAALGALNQLAAEAGFQAENEGQPVQIMGIPETAGLGFDYLWIAGMTDEAWPRRPSPNPFLPISLQRAANVPRSTARRELDYAVRTSARLLNCAGTVVVSCIEREQDRLLRPSPLFTELARTQPPVERAAFWPEAAALEALDDHAAPAVAADFVPRGGTRILELQAKCPFRAFAEIRLGAKSLEVSESGLNPRDRGSLLHLVLEHVWNAIASQAELKAMTEDDLRAQIRAGIEAAFRHRFHKAAFEDPFEREVRLIEAARLEALVFEWMGLEKRRSAFTVIGQEKGERVRVGALQFDARIDRVDRLASGREVIIDYKTGDVSTGAWEGERPDSPQVPIYAIAHDRPVGAVAFAKIQPDSCCFEGIAQESNALPDVATGDLAARLAEWRRVFATLAAAFVAGDARVDPKTFPGTCEFCKLGPFCRISPAIDEATL
jgi:probable DNA repair protein